MKKLTLVIPLLILFHSCKKDTNDIKIYLSENWTQLNIETETDLTKAFFIDDKTGFVAGRPSIDSIHIETIHNLGYLYLASSPLIVTDSNKYFSYNVNFVLSENPQPSFFKTSDAGDTWTNIKTPFVSQITDIFFLDEYYGFVITKYEGVFKTTDGGNNWVKVLASFIFPGNNCVVLNSYSMIRFFNKMEGFVYIDDNYSNIIIQTQDGGSSWSFISNNADTLNHNYWMDRFEIARDKKAGFFCNIQGYIYKTINRGNTWELISERNEYLVDISFLTEDTGYFASSSSIFKTIDGGANWERIKSLNLDIDYNSKIFGFETGEIITTNFSENKIYLSKDDGANFEMIFYLGENQLNAVCFPTNNTGFALGNHGQIFRYSKNNEF